MKMLVSTLAFVAAAYSGVAQAQTLTVSTTSTAPGSAAPIAPVASKGE